MLRQSVLIFKSQGLGNGSRISVHGIFVLLQRQHGENFTEFHESQIGLHFQAVSSGPKRIDNKVFIGPAAEIVEVVV